MPCMEITVMDQHSVVDTTFTSRTLQAPTRIPTPTWVTRMFLRLGTNTPRVTREACWQALTISNPMRWKCSIRLTRTDVGYKTRMKLAISHNRCKLFSSKEVHHDSSILRTSPKIFKVHYFQFVSISSLPNHPCLLLVYLFLSKTR